MRNNEQVFFDRISVNFSGRVEMATSRMRLSYFTIE
jgi:hypothetical protein